MQNQPKQKAITETLKDLWKAGVLTAAEYHLKRHQAKQAR